MLHTSRPATPAWVRAVGGLMLLEVAAVRAQSFPDVIPNDNRVPAGELREGVLRLSLVARLAVWSPEGEGGPGVVVEALAEEGAAPTRCACAW